MSRPFVEVNLSTTRPFQQPRSVEVHQEIGHHDVARFRTRERRISSPRWMTGALASIRYGWAPDRIRSMAAYVYEAQPESRAGAPEQARHEVTCIGVTYPFKSRGTKTWTDVKTWTLVEEFGRKHRIRTRVDQLGKSWSSVSQRGRSEWAMLAEMAAEDGLLLFISGNVIHLRDPRRLEEEERATSLVYSLKRSGAQRIRKVRTDLGELTADGVSAAEFQAQGVSPLGDPIVVSSTSRAYRDRAPRTRLVTEYVDTPVRSIADAREEVAAAERAGYFVYTAEVDIDGDPRIRPGRGIYLEGVGERVAGFWLVKRATHRVQSDSYVTTIEVGRPQPYRTGRSPVISDNRRVLVSAGADYRPERAKSGVRVAGKRWVSA